MSDNIIQLNEDLIKHDLKDLVRSSVEETLNALLDTITQTEIRRVKAKAVRRLRIPMMCLIAYSR